MMKEWFTWSNINALQLIFDISNMKIGIIYIGLQLIAMTVLIFQQLIVDFQMTVLRTLVCQ